MAIGEIEKITMTGAFDAFTVPQGCERAMVQSRGDLPIATAPSLWLSARFPSTLGFGTYPAVSSWADRSANGFNASQALSTKQPAYVRNALNGRPALYFDSGDVLNLGNSNIWSNTYGLCIFAVIKSDPASNGEIIAKYKTTGNLKEFHLFLNSADWGNNFWVVAETGSTHVALTVNTLTGLLTTACVITARWKPGVEHTLYYNGLLKGTAVTAVDHISTGLTEELRIGSYEGGVSNYYDGYIGEIIAFPHGLTEAEQYAMEMYLGYNWGIRIP